LVYLQPFRRNSVLKCALHPKIAKNSVKPFLGIQGRSRSSILINQKSLLSVPVMISSMSVPICKHFHTIPANNGKITSFYGGTPLKPLRSRGSNSRTQKHEILSRLTRVLAAEHSEDFVILACTVLTQYSSVTDGQTDGQTSGHG